METDKLQALMIRGDLLLLTLDVFHYVARFCRYDCPSIARTAKGIHDFEVSNPRRCSRDKVLEVLLERCSFIPKTCPRGPSHNMYCTSDNDLNFTDGVPGRLQIFLRDQQAAGILNEQRFALAQWVVQHTAYCCNLDATFVLSLFRLIAAGELMEDDFKEDVK